ncbi:hypothetical protein [Pedobacter borealis]|uniref:hypothetical protein n=1 Tax=Pedobacter borealis TaxID=475254 RepID=UPI000492F468|nr:hypothetical protein [Pedobacter borealis]
MKFYATSSDFLFFDKPHAIRQGQVVMIEEHQGIIIDDNGQNIAFDVLECVETVHVGADISFCIAPQIMDFELPKISLLYVEN